MKTRAPLALLTAATLLAGCAAIMQQRVENHEDLLAAAGFTARPANTPQRQLALQTLPADRMVRHQRGDRFVYLYADPVVCDCLYIGDQTAYGRYQQELLQRRIAQENIEAAQLNENAAWDWSFWGPGWWYP